VIDEDDNIQAIFEPDEEEQMEIKRAKDEIQPEAQKMVIKKMRTNWN
jgi:hypothetical protein